MAYANGNMFQIAISTICILLLFGYGISLLFRERRNFPLYGMVALLGCCLLLEVFDLLAVVNTAQFLTWKEWGLRAEALLPPCFLWVSLSLYRRGSWRGFSFLARGMLLLSPAFLVTVLVFPIGKFFYAPDFPTEKILFLGEIGYLFYLCELFYLTYSLAQLERTLRALPRVERWKAKFEILGLCTLLAIFLYYYSQGLLYRSIDMGLIPVRSLTLIVSVGLMAFSRWFRGEARKVRLSPEMAFRSVTILMVGGYLVSLGLAGVGMRYLSNSFQDYLFIFLAFLTGLGLVVVLLSDTLRRKVRVFLQKNFYTQKYDYRVQWLQFTNQLAGTRNEEELQKAILSFFADTFCVRGAGLFLIDPDRREFRQVARFDMAESSEIFHRNEPFVEFIEERNWVLNTDYDTGAKGLVSPERKAFFKREEYSFLIPLQFDRQLEGIIALGSQINEGEELTFEDFDLMKMLARQATSTLLNLKLSAQLSTARELAAIGKISAFVLHDLKNLVSGLALVSENAKSYIDEPEFQKDMLGTLSASVVKMRDLIVRLKQMEGKSTLNLEVCDLRAVVAEGVREARAEPVVSKGGAVFARMDPVEIHKVVLNLVLNALEAGNDPSSVSVEVGKEAEAFFRVTDAGCGISEEFIRERLFKPFESTKKSGFGIGLYQCKNIVDAHGGRIEVKSALDEGTAFTVWLPLAAEGG